MAVTRRALLQVLASIPVWPSTRSMSQIYDAYSYNRDAGAATVESQKRRIKDRLKKIAEEPVGGGGWLNYEDGKPLRFYWATDEAKDYGLRHYGETKEMSLSRALAYNLIQKHLAHVLPPGDAEELDYWFRAAKHRLSRGNQGAFANQPISELIEINPLTVPMTPSPRHTENYRVIFDAIEKRLVIRAKYKSVHTSVPDEIVFSPQKICMLGSVVSVHGFLHNPTQFAYKIESGQTGLHRMLDIDSMENLTSQQGPYVSVPSPTKTCTLKAYIHKWVMRNLKRSGLGRNQRFDRIAENSDGAQLLEHSIIDVALDDWRAFTCEVDLPKHFRAEGYDGWFLATMIGQLGADMLVVEPPEVVEVLNDRLDKLVRFREMRRGSD